MDRTDCRAQIDAAMREADKIGWIISQSAGELSAAAVEIARTNAGIVMEIGCQHGGWMFAVRPFCRAILKYVAIDPAFSTGWPLYSARLRESGVEVCEIPATSQAAVSLAREALAGRRVDVLHIDGSHVAAEALWDFDAYTPFVRDGGLVLMHDVCGSQGPGETLRILLGSTRVARIRETHIVCDTWSRPPNERMGIAMLRL